MGQRPLVRLGAAVAGGLLALAAAAPALAADTTVPLKDDHKGTTATQFPERECDRIFTAKADDEDGWHVVLTQFSFRGPGSPTSALEDLSLSFTDAGGNPVTIDLGNLGSFDHLPVITGGAFHLWLVTPAGWTLVDGSVTVKAGNVGQNPQFNLSHTCPAEPPTSEEPPPGSEEPPPGSEEPVPPASEEPTAPGSEEPTPPASGKPDGPGLPVTGMSLGGLLVLSGGLLSAGIALVAVRRRRSLSDLLNS